MKREFYYVRVDARNKFTPTKYHKVTCEELDEMIDVFADRVLSICSNGNNGAMTMWACFKSALCRGCYSDLINAYRLLSGDSKSLVDREHELRHAWEEYIELKRIRLYGSLYEYYMKKAEESKRVYDKYIKD